MNNEKFNSGNKNIAIIIMSVASAIMIIASVIIFLILNRETAYVENNQKDSDENPVLIVTSCPPQVTTEAPEFTIEGVMMGKTSSCVLTINDEVVASASDKNIQTKWSKTYSLKPGEIKELKIVVKDNNNFSATETRSVFCQNLNKIEEPPKRNTTAPITPGCSLVKKKAGGLNIREYAGLDYDVVAYIAPKDYNSSMTFTGYYEVDYDGFTWYEVIAPNGKHGYVRSDLVVSCK